MNTFLTELFDVILTKFDLTHLEHLWLYEGSFTKLGA
jgi:hypothetical protein